MVAQARSSRLDWTKLVNIVVMECHYMSKPVNEEGKLSEVSRRIFNFLNARGIRTDYVTKSEQ